MPVIFGPVHEGQPQHSHGEHKDNPTQKLHGLSFLPAATIDTLTVNSNQISRLPGSGTARSDFDIRTSNLASASLASFPSVKIPVLQLVLIGVDSWLTPFAYVGK